MPEKDFIIETFSIKFFFLNETGRPAREWVILRHPAILNPCGGSAELWTMIETGRTRFPRTGKACLVN